MLKNLRAIDKNDLANICNQFLLVYGEFNIQYNHKCLLLIFFKLFYSLKEKKEKKDTNAISDHLNVCEVKKCMELINLVWHRVFSIIRLYMNKGIDIMDASNKH